MKKQKFVSFHCYKCFRRFYIIKYLEDEVNVCPYCENKDVVPDGEVLISKKEN